MAIEVLGDNTADLAKARGERNADVFTEVVKAFEYPETHPCIKVRANPGANRINCGR